MTTQQGDGGQDNPHQELFYRLGFACFIGSVVAGIAAIDEPALGFLCIGLALMTCGFFAAFTVIHVRH